MALNTTSLKSNLLGVVAVSTLVLTATALDPHLGMAVTFVTCLLDGVTNACHLDRLALLINDLNEKIAVFPDSDIDKEYLKSEEFYDLAVMACNAAVRTRDKEKIELYSRILQGAWSIQKDKQENCPEDFLRSLSELTSREIKILKVIYDVLLDCSYTESDSSLLPLGVAWAHINEQIKEVMPDVDLVYSLLMIERVGLIKEVTRSAFNYKGGYYVMTPTLNKIMRFLEVN